MTRLADLLLLSRCVAVDAAHEPEQCRAAIAWTLVNRAREAALHTRCRGVPHPDFGGGSVREACLRMRPGLPPLAHARFGEPAPCRALATACLVACSDLADPTGGATHYHHHADTPAWSNALTPVALIGSYLFYRKGPHFRSAP